MSTLVLMKLLESAPRRYEAAMRVITLGWVDRAGRRLVDLALGEGGPRVLELGCGTGAVTKRLLEAGANVDALDQNPDMLDVARRELGGIPASRLRFHECAAAEIDGWSEDAYDAVVAGLLFSEMSSRERSYVFRQVGRVLRPGGVLVVADEVLPRGRAARFLHRALRLPLALFTWLLTGSQTRPIDGLEAEMSAVGLGVVSVETSLIGSHAVVCARRP
ncbi:MAG: corrinoid protein-associated methyltransferase CpaM [Candidatus Binatia bacterium]